MNQVKMHSDDELRVAQLNKSIDKLESVIQDYKDEIEQIQRKLKWTTFDLENQIEERDKIVNIYLRAQPFRSFKSMEGYDEKFEYADMIKKAYGIQHSEYSAFEHNFDEIAIEGKAMVTNSGWLDYDWRVSVENPTWLDIYILSDKMIKETGDFHHIFLEGIHLDNSDKTGTTYLLSMGS